MMAELAQHMYACNRQDLSNTSGSGETEAISSAGSPHFSCARQLASLLSSRAPQGHTGMAHAAYIYIYVYITIQKYIYICLYVCTYEGILHISRRPSAHWRTSMREALMNCSGEENLAGRLLQKTTSWSMRLLLAGCVFFVSLSLSLCLSPSVCI